MRVVKLAEPEFADLGAVVDFFTGEIQGRNSSGLFRFRTQIGEGELAEGETLLFTYDAHLRFIAKALSGLLRPLGRSSSTRRGAMGRSAMAHWPHNSVSIIGESGRNSTPSMSNWSKRGGRI